MQLQPHIFRQYDIRGIVGEDLDADVVEAVGRACGSELAERLGREGPRVAVGHDNRPSSPDLFEGLVRGLQATGAHVVEVGCVPTPTLYWAEAVLETDAGIQITGSHNPSEWNGIKMSFQGRALYGEGVQALLHRIQEGRLLEGRGSRSREDIRRRYIDDVVGRLTLEGPVTAAVDCGNGTASVVAVDLLEGLGATVHPLYCESDGTFPNHHPDPTVDEYLEDLVARVRETGSDVGIAFDGDGDRLGVVDGDGRVVRGDSLLLLFGQDLLEREGPGRSLVFDVKCSQLLPEGLERAGGHPVMWKTGHSLIKEKMRELQAPIGGELSGHFCFSDRYLGFDDALYAAGRLLEILSRTERSLAELVDEQPSYVSTPEIRIEASEESKEHIVQAAQEHFAERYEVVDVDGARILFGDGWALLRSSNTQPVIVARYEARSPERLGAIRSEVESWLEKQGVDV